MVQKKGKDAEAAHNTKLKSVRDRNKTRVYSGEEALLEIHRKQGSYVGEGKSGERKIQVSVVYRAAYMQRQWNVYE